jgi:hypothetical protein
MRIETDMILPSALGAKRPADWWTSRGACYDYPEEGGALYLAATQHLAKRPSREDVYSRTAETELTQILAWTEEITCQTFGFDRRKQVALPLGSVPHHLSPE